MKRSQWISREVIAMSHAIFDKDWNYVTAKDNYDSPLMKSDDNDIIFIPS